MSTDTKTFFLFRVDFPELLSCLCFTKRGFHSFVRLKPLTTDYPLFSVEKNCEIVVDSSHTNSVMIRIFFFPHPKVLHFFFCHSLGNRTRRKRNRRRTRGRRGRTTTTSRRRRRGKKIIRPMIMIIIKIIIIFKGAKMAVEK